MLRAGLSLSILFAMTAPAFSQSGAVEGLGALPCSKLIEVRSTDESAYIAFGAWIGGFLTAANIYEDDTHDLTPWQPLQMSLAQIVKYCEDHPDKPVVHGLRAYMNYLKQNRMTAPSEIITLAHNGESMMMYASVVARVRAVLMKDGYLTEDGEGYNNALTAALMRYQRDQGLTPSGLPDLPTMLRLFPKG